MIQKNLYITREKNKFTDVPSYTIQKQHYKPRDNKVKNICVFHWLQYDSDKHLHDYIELAYVVSGKLIHYVGDEKHILGKGDFIFLNYNDVHQYKLQSGKSAYIINCVFLPRFLNPMLEDCNDLNELLAASPFNYLKWQLNANPGRHVFKDDKSKRIRNLLEDMIKEYDSSDSGNEEIMKSHLTEIIIRAVRQILITDSNTRDELILKAITYGKDNIKTPDLSINKFAELNGISRQHISRRFKEETGKTFSEYLRHLRINMCLNDILSDRFTIKEIAENAGYRDINTFYKHFKLETGYTPGEYKKQTP